MWQCTRISFMGDIAGGLKIVEITVSTLEAKQPFKGGGSTPRANLLDNVTLWWPIISHRPEQGHETLPTCSQICMAPIRQLLNCSCCLYSCSVPLTPRRAQGLSGKNSINQAQTDCYNFTLFLLSFHTFNEFRGLLLSEELLSRPQQKKNQLKECTKIKC